MAANSDKKRLTRGALKKMQEKGNLEGGNKNSSASSASFRGDIYKERFLASQKRDIEMYRLQGEYGPRVEGFQRRRRDLCDMQGRGDDLKEELQKVEEEERKVAKEWEEATKVVSSQFEAVLAAWNAETKKRGWERSNYDALPTTLWDLPAEVLRYMFSFYVEGGGDPRTLLGISKTWYRVVDASSVLWKRLVIGGTEKAAGCTTVKDIQLALRRARDQLLEVVLDVGYLSTNVEEYEAMMEKVADTMGRWTSFHILSIPDYDSPYLPKALVRHHRIITGPLVRLQTANFTQVSQYSPFMHSIFQLLNNAPKLRTLYASSLREPLDSAPFLQRITKLDVSWCYRFGKLHEYPSIQIARFGAVTLDATLPDTFIHIRQLVLYDCTFNQRLVPISISLPNVSTLRVERITLIGYQKDMKTIFALPLATHLIIASTTLGFLLLVESPLLEHLEYIDRSQYGLVKVEDFNMLKKRWSPPSTLKRLSIENGVIRRVFAMFLEMMKDSLEELVIIDTWTPAASKAIYEPLCSSLKLNPVFFHIFHPAEAYVCCSRLLKLSVTSSFEYTPQSQVSEWLEEVRSKQAAAGRPIQVGVNVVDWATVTNIRF